MGFLDTLWKIFSPESSLNEPQKPITGTSYMDFPLKGLYFRSEEEKTNIPNLKPGKFCYLMRELYNEYDDKAVAVFNNGWQMGYVDREVSSTVAALLRENKHQICQIIEVNPIEGKCPEVILRLFYRDSKGTETLPDQSGALEWFIVESSKFTGEVTDDYMMIFETYEVVDRHLEMYGVTHLPEDDTELLLQINEDDIFMIQFVNELCRGYIWDKHDKSEFVRDATQTRGYGDSRILSRRIQKYLDFKKIYLPN